MKPDKYTTALVTKILADLGGEAGLEELNVKTWNASVLGLRLLIGEPELLRVDICPQADQLWGLEFRTADGKKKKMKDISGRSLKSTILQVLAPIKH